MRFVEWEIGGSCTGTYPLRVLLLFFNLRRSAVGCALQWFQVSDQANGDRKGRLDRVEEMLEVLVNEHIQFGEEHRQLLKAQVLLYDSVQQLSEAQKATEQKLAALAAAQQHTDERMAALIAVIDGLVRRPSA